MSFHGLPRYTVERGDPYYDECQATASLLASALGLAPEQWQITFQSRFGRTEWLQPYTSVVLADLAKQGVGRVDIACPGFPADCLETLEEIGMEGREDFLAAGGQELRLIPCLNERDDWIRALAALACRQMAGWIDPG
jgi:ferrochelatase